MSQQQGLIDSVVSSERHPSSAQTTVPNLGQEIPSEAIHKYCSRMLFTKFKLLLRKTLVSIFIILIIYGLFFGLVYINIQITHLSQPSCHGLDSGMYSCFFSLSLLLSYGRYIMILSKGAPFKG